MILKNTLLEKLQPYKGNKKIIVDQQSTNDIVKGILNTHEKYKTEYDKIYKYFIGATLEDTCRNIWNFVKQNIPYKIESEKTQYLRSPAAILVSNNDCKCYSLFTNGVLDAYRRNTGKNFDLYYRFAGYNGHAIEHVFSYVNANGKKDFWIDAVLPTFDNRKEPIYIKDKKIKPMALIAVNGIAQNNLQKYPAYTRVGKRYESVGNCGCRSVGTIGARRRISGTAISPYYEAMINKLGLRPDVYVPGTVVSKTLGFGAFDPKGAFADCNFDNSTYHWKCIRGKHLNNWTPIERMLWYLQGLNANEIPIEWVETYADGYGNKPDSDKVSYDNSRLPYNLVEVWNQTIKTLTRNTNFLLEEDLTIGYDPKNSITIVGGETPPNGHPWVGPNGVRWNNVNNYVWVDGKGWEIPVKYAKSPLFPLGIAISLLTLLK